MVLGDTMLYTGETLPDERRIVQDRDGLFKANARADDRLPIHIQRSLRR
jgi:hypothetical protein